MSSALESKIEAIFNKARMEALSAIIDDELHREPPPPPTASEQRDGYLDYEGAAAYLGVEERTVRTWVSDWERTKIPFRKAGILVRFKREELDAWTARNTLRQAS